MAMLMRSSGTCIVRSSRPSVIKAAIPSRTFVRSAAPCRKVSVVPRAQYDDQVDTNEVVRDLQRKWDRVENKPQVVIYTIGAVIALWLSSGLLGSVNRIPLIPRVFELVGLVYSGYFTWRYLLFKSGRQELLSNIEEARNSLSGEADAIADDVRDVGNNVKDGARDIKNTVKDGARDFKDTVKDGAKEFSAGARGVSSRPGETVTVSSSGKPAPRGSTTSISVDALDD